MKATKIPVQRLDVKEALDLAEKHVRFVDVRSAASIARNPWRISGASHMTSKDLAEGVRQLSKDQTIVAYCS